LENEILKMKIIEMKQVMKESADITDNEITEFIKKYNSLNLI
jgi:hypothetical protein